MPGPLRASESTTSVVPRRRTCTLVRDECSPTTCTSGRSQVLIATVPPGTSMRSAVAPSSATVVSVGCWARANTAIVSVANPVIVPSPFVCRSRVRQQQRGRLPQDAQLVLLMGEQQPVEQRALRVARERLARLVDRRVDRPQALLDRSQGLGGELAAALLQRVLELEDGL